MKHLFKLVILSTIIFACNYPQKIKDKEQADYQEIKGRINAKLTSHFPIKLSSKKYKIYFSKKIEENNISLFLYEEGLSEKMMSDIKQNAQIQMKALFKTEDSCLLVLNLKNYSQDSIHAKKYETVCDTLFFPVPYFKNSNTNTKSLTNLNSNFVIYVLDAKPGINFQEYKLSPLFGMPFKWQNGYSKGIAINELENSVIYWVILW
jgi:hypothetical protein